MIRELEQEFQLVEKPFESMRVALLSPEIYEKIYFLLTKEMGAGGTSAGYVQDFGEVLVTLDNELDYQRASTIYHEFVHMFIDSHVQVFVKNIDEKTGTISEDSSYARSGLSVDRHVVSRNTPEPTTTTRGDLLNELGNYLEQNRFLEHILENPDYVEDANKRLELLKKLGLKKDWVYDISVKNKEGKMVPVRITQNCIHPDKDGNLETSESYFYMLLASDIDKVCSKGESSGDFRNLLLSAKIHPERQYQLRSLIDSKFGKGFYSRLKSAEYNTDDLIDLLVEVQSVLYPKLNHQPT